MGSVAADRRIVRRAHLSNPNATPTSTITIAVSGGLMLGLAYVITQRLWLPIGLHFAWNATQAVLGLPVSGQHAPGLGIDATVWARPADRRPLWH